MSYGDPRARTGAILLAVLLVLFSLSAIAIGVLFAATQELSIGAAHERALRARLAAENAALAALDTLLRDPPAADWRGERVLADVITPDGLAIRAWIEGGSGGWLLARAEARDAAGTVSGASLVARAGDPLRFSELFPGAVYELGVAPADSGEASPNRLALAAELAAALEGEDAGQTIRDGAGLAVVRGSLRLEAGARFAGALLVVDELDVEAGAEINGAVTVLPGATARVLGDVRFDPAAVRAALLEPPALRRARLGERLWLPQF
jgi:hypothetical protein